MWPKSEIYDCSYIYIYWECRYEGTKQWYTDTHEKDKTNPDSKIEMFEIPTKKKNWSSSCVAHTNDNKALREAEEHTS